MDSTLPIIRLEIEGMKYAIQTALSRHATEMDTYTNEAIEQFCTEENIHRIVSTKAKALIEAAVVDELKCFFDRGNGRKAIEQAVNDVLMDYNKNHPTIVRWDDGNLR